MMKYANLTDRQRRSIEQQVKSKGYLKLGEGLPTKIVKCKEVGCPICDNPLEIYTSGNSYQISCETHGKIVVARAYAVSNFG